MPAGCALFLTGYRYYSALLRGRPLDPLSIAAGVGITVAVVLSAAILRSE